MVTDIRQKLSDLLTRRIGPHRFELWFGAPTTFRLSDGTLFVEAKDHFLLGRIRAQFDQDLRAVIAAVVPPIKQLAYGLLTPQPAETPAAAADRTEAIPPPGQFVEASPRGEAERPVATGFGGRKPLSEFFGFEFSSQNALLENSIKHVIERPGQISPLFLYGEVGCGKSELLTRSVRSIRHRSKKRGICVTAEQFTSHFVEALKGRALPGFRQKYRELDVLAVDDIQFFDNKRATIVEFQNTIDQLQRNGKQILLAADRPPSQLTFLGSELVHRIAAGLTCQVNYPCVASRIRILTQQCDERGLSLSAVNLESIAQRLNGDVRQLHGAVNRLHVAELARMNLQSWESVYAILQDLFRAGRRAVSMETIEQAVSDVCGVPGVELRSSKRSKRINVARDLAMWLARKHIGSAYSEIGSHYGGRSHSTVISAQKKVHRWLQSGETIALPDQQRCPAGEIIQQIEWKLRIG